MFYKKIKTANEGNGLYQIHRKKGWNLNWTLCNLSCILFLTGCTPTIKVVTDDKPIEVNLNVKVEFNNAILEFDPKCSQLMTFLSNPWSILVYLQVHQLK